MKILGIGGLLTLSVLLSPYQTFGVELTVAERAESKKIALTLPIADLHDHDGYAPKLGKETGVVWSGSGGKKGGRTSWYQLKEEFGDKRIGWAGQAEFNKAYLYRSGGMSEMLDFDNFGDLYEETKKDLKAGLIVGIGEIFINNLHSNRQVRMQRKGQVDAPVFRKFFDLLAKYDGWLGFHMEADLDSMDELGKLLAYNRKGRVLWNHCGTNSTTSKVRSMLDKHPNLFCEFSFRFPPVNKKPARNIFTRDGIDPSWRALMESHSDRFMVGTDAHNEKQFFGAIKTIRKGLLPNLKPETARKVAYQNAQRLFKLKGKP